MNLKQILEYPCYENIQDSYGFTTEELELALEGGPVQFQSEVDEEISDLLTEYFQNKEDIVEHYYQIKLEKTVKVTFWITIFCLFITVIMFYLDIPYYKQFLFSISVFCSILYIFGFYVVHSYDETDNNKLVEIINSYLKTLSFYERSTAQKTMASNLVLQTPEGKKECTYWIKNFQKKPKIVEVWWNLELHLDAKGNFQCIAKSFVIEPPEKGVGLTEVKRIQNVA